MYLLNTLVLESFKRLRTNPSHGKRGKTPMERTSSLMIMLSVDALSKIEGTQAIDVDFEKSKSKEMRKRLCLEYCKLVSVGSTADGQPQSIHELGYVKVGGKDPQSRLSSNFMTTQLKDAKDAETSFEYPRRPAPLLSLGKVATGIPFGIQLHPSWEEGFAQHLGDVSSNTPFTDLAMVRLRYTSADAKNNLTDTLCAMLKSLHSKEVSDFWCVKIRAEKAFAKHLKHDVFMEDTLVDSLSCINNTESRKTELMQLDKETLVDMVINLENA